MDNCQEIDVYQSDKDRLDEIAGIVDRPIADIIHELVHPPAYQCLHCEESFSGNDLPEVSIDELLLVNSEDNASVPKEIQSISCPSCGSDVTENDIRILGKWGQY